MNGNRDRMGAEFGKRCILDALHLHRRLPCPLSSTRGCKAVEVKSELIATFSGHSVCFAGVPVSGDVTTSVCAHCWYAEEQSYCAIDSGVRCLG